MFYSMSHDGHASSATPWIRRVVCGLAPVSECLVCRGIATPPIGSPMMVVVDRREVRRWPDVLPCGDYPILVVSERVLTAWAADGLGTFPVSPVTLAESPVGVPAPPYFALRGEEMLGARLDFEASGYVDVRWCPSCERRLDDTSATYTRQRSRVFGDVFVPSSWNGAHVFTTDLSPTAFFCTRAVFECAGRHRLMNFRFVPIERSASSVEGEGYL